MDINATGIRMIWLESASCGGAFGIIKRRFDNF